MQTGWVGDLEEIPAGRQAREILAEAMAPPSLGEERRAFEARRAAETKAADRADDLAFRAFIGVGHDAAEILARAEDPVDVAHRTRVHRARELLAREGLGDLLPGAVGGAILDANVGFVATQGMRVTRGEALERATIVRDRRERARRESAGLGAIQRARQARPVTWGERVASFIGGG
jgi:hypothetical protein